MIILILAAILVIALLPRSLRNLAQYRQSIIMQKAKRYSREVSYDNECRKCGQTSNESIE